MPIVFEPLGVVASIHPGASVRPSLTPCATVRRPLALACVGLLCSASVLAQAPGAPLEPVVVSASRSEQRVLDALPAAQVFTRADIQRSGASELSEVLRGVAGLEWAQAGARGTQSGVHIRGAESRHTLVLVDGTPINNLNFGLPALEHVALSDVERIEVVRGNVSALYGSAALGGVIQIFTRAGAGGHALSVGAQAGSLGFARADVHGRLALGQGTSLRMSAEKLRERGLDATDQVKLPGTNPDRDGYQRNAVSLGVDHLYGAGDIQLNLRESSARSAYDSPFGPTSQADESDADARQWSASWRHRLAPAWQLQAQISGATDQLRADLTAYPYWVNSHRRSTTLGLKWQAALGHELSANVEQTRQRVESDTVYTRDSRTQNSFQLGYLGRAGAQQWQLSLRRDRYSDFGTVSTGLLGYGYQLSTAWRISAMRSSGFNAPSFNDLFYPWGGNPALRPEAVRSSELALQHTGKASEFRLTAFNNRYRDLIGFDSNYNTVNVASARNRGVEATYRAQLGVVRLQVDLTRQNPVDLATGLRLSRRAETLAHLGLATDWQGWAWQGDLRRQGARRDGAQTLSAYSVVDVQASRALSAKWRLGVRVDNLFDRAYETVYGYTQPGRSLRVSLRWTM